MSSPDKLTIETPEQTFLEFPLAGIGSRFLAVAFDTVLQSLAALVLFLVAVLLLKIPFPRPKAGLWVIALFVILGFVLEFGYFAFFEAVWNGQTPGKRYARLRVMRDSGGPITVYEAIARNLLRLVDQLPGLYVVGIVSALLSRQNKRLGDYVAGTVVVHERPLEGVQPLGETGSKTSAPLPAAARLSPEELQLIETFLQRRASLEPAVRRHMAAQIADRLGDKLGIPQADRIRSETFLEALAEQGRNLARYR